MHHSATQPEETIGIPPQLIIPPVTALTPEQMSERQEAIDRILLRRHQRGPIGIAADELKHLARSESEE